MAKLLQTCLLMPLVITGWVAAYENCKQDDCGRAARTRRNAPMASCSNGAKTRSQARSILDSYKDKFNKTAFDAVTMNNKSRFVREAKGLLLGVCKNMTVRGPPAVASSTLAHLHVQRTACNDTASSLLDIPCQGCSPQKVAKYQIMSSFLAKTAEWNCSQSNSICDGVCSGSLRMSNDLISNYSTKCLSQVIHVQVFNPKTSLPVSIPRGNQAVMGVQIEFNKGNKSYQSSNFKCALWKEEGRQWNVTVCTLRVVPKAQRNDSYLADCNCTRFGSVCVVPSHTVFPPSGSSGSSGSGGGNWDSSGESATTSSNQTTTSPSGGGASGGSNSSSATTSPNQATTSPSGGGSDGGSNSSSATTSPNQATTSPSGGGSDGGSNSSSATTSPNQATTSPSGRSGSSGGGQSGSLYVSMTFSGDCKTIISTSKEGEMITKTKSLLQQKLDIQESQVVEIKLTCGSIVITFTINQLNSSTLDVMTNKIGSITISNDFSITFTDGTKLVVTKSLVGLSAGNLTAFYPPSTTDPPTTSKRYELQFDYRPIMFTIALGILTVVLCVCCTCILHSWFLRKNKFTKYNSMTAEEYEKKMKAKEDKNRMKEVEEVSMTVIGTSSKVSPCNFDMSNETMPQINERSFTNYDWAHTSFVPPTTQPDQVDEVEQPRLILDEESNSDSDSGEDNQGFVSDEQTPTFPRAVSHLSLEKDGLKPESSDALSNIVPPLYDNTIAEEENYDQNIYETLDDIIPNNHRPAPSASRPQTEPEYSNVE